MNKKIIGVVIVVAILALLTGGTVFTVIRRSSAMAAALPVQAASIDQETEQSLEQKSEFPEMAGEFQHEDDAVAIENLPLGELSQEETDALLFMREEEKLARDVYLALAEMWGQPTFSNIAASEQTHMDSMLELIQRYNLADPVLAENGRFTNPDLQVLYVQLIETGTKSLVDALKVGAAIEEIDIRDLKMRLELTDQEDIKLVFENLMFGSYNHLSAFSSIYEAKSGLSYEPQYLTPEEFQLALSQGGVGQGRGIGQGQGGGRR